MSDYGRVSAGGIEAVFERSDDRIAHTIRLGSGTAAQPLLISHEGHGEQPWPASPPLQQLHLEERPGDVQVALLVGMAGSSHWSMSCEADPHAKTLTFDVAVRVKRSIQKLGSLYRVVRGIEWDAETHCLASHCEVHYDAATTQLDCEQGIFLRPIELPADVPTTVQWRYVIAFTDSSS